MEAKWNPDEDYYIRLKPSNERPVNQNDIEQQLVINLMQLINARHINQPTKRLPIRVSSYGSWETAKMDVLQEVIEMLQQKARDKMGEKFTLEKNADKIRWAKEIQELSNSIAALQNILPIIEENFKNK